MAAKGFVKMRRAVRHAQRPMVDGELRAIGRLYRLCTDAYLVMNGGSRVNIEALLELYRWELLANQNATALQMRKWISAVVASRAILSTISSAKRRQRQHGLQVGVTDGPLLIYFVKPEDDCGKQGELKLLYVGGSRASERLTMFYCAKPHARTRQM